MVDRTPRQAREQIACRLLHPAQTVNLDSRVGSV